MNKVTSYLKNSTRSVVYATADVGKNLIPEVSEFIDTNGELFKAVYSTVSHSKKAVAYGKRLAKESQVYKDINTGINNVISDIKTGNFYNKEREQAAYDSTADYMMGGDEDFDMGDFDDDFNFDDDDDGSLDSFNDKPAKKASISRSDAAIVDGVSKSSNLSAQLISKTVANTSKAVMNTQVGAINMLIAQNVELTAGIRTSIAGVHESINSILKFSQDNIVKQINNEATYFARSQELLEDNNKVLHELLDIQKNMYKTPEKAESSDQFSKIFSGSTIDLTEYFKTIGKNIKNIDPTGTLDMMMDTGMGSSMLSQMFTNPLGEVLTGLIAGFMPKSLAKSIMNFNKTLGGFFPAMITRINRFKDQDGLLGIIGKIFGVKMDSKNSIDTSKYNKGAVPFDGITRKAIVDVIPEHLSKIESLLSGQSQRTYDYDSGKWMDTSEIKKKQLEEYQRMVNDTFADVNDTINAYRKKMIETKSLNFDSLKTLDSDIQKMKERTFREKNGHFSPDDFLKDLENYGFTGFMSDDKVIKGLLNSIKNGPVSNIMGVSSRTADAKRRYADRLKDDEINGISVNRKLYDNSKTNSHLEYDENYKDQIVGMKANSGILFKDKLGNSALDYLKEITMNLSFIRAGGSTGKATMTFDDFKKSYESKHVPENIKTAKEKLDKEKESYNNRNYEEGKDPESYALTVSDMAKYQTKDNNLDNNVLDSYGRWVKNDKSETRWNSVPGKNFGEKWKNCRTFKDRFNLLMGSMQKAVKRPTELLEKVINTANESIYHLLFEAEFDPDLDDEEDGPREKIKGLFGKALDSMQAAWTVMTTNLTEKVIDPLVKKYHLDEKWDEFKNKVSNSSVGQKFKDIKNGVKDALKSNLSGLKDYTVNSVKDVASPIINDPIIAKMRMAYNDARIAQLQKNPGNKKEESTPEQETIKKTQAAVANVAKLQNSPGNKKEGDVKKSEETKVDNTQTTEQARKANIAKTQRGKGNKNGRISKKAEGGIYDGPDGTKIVVANDHEDIFVANRDFKNIDKNAKKENRVANKLKSLLGNKFDITKAVNGDASISSYEAKNEEIKNNMNESGPITATVDFIQTAATATGQYVGQKFTNVLGISDETKQKVEKDKKKIFDKIGGIFGDLKGSGYDIAAKGILGGGIGLLTGVTAGPLIGAAVGAGASIIKNSQTVQKFLFGEKTVDENGNITDQKGGIINKDIQNTFKKYIPNIGKYGITGALSSLIMPYGPLAGAAIGAGIGIIKSSETMNNMIFGDDDGLFNKDRKNKIKKAFPAATVGAIGGLFLGPFGVLGNAAVGAGVGLLTQTEEFKDLIFGTDDGTGERFGGLKGTLDDYFVNPLKDFASDFKDNFFEMLKENMIDPLNEAITPITREIGDTVKKVVFFIPNIIKKFAEDKVGAPIMAVLKDKIVDPILGAITGVAKRGINTAKTVAFLPFKAIGGIGRHYRRKQIRQGRADYMGAEERLQFMNGNEYNYEDQDKALAGMNDEQIAQALSMVNGSVEGLDYFDRKIKSNNRKLGNQISSNFKEGHVFGGKAGKIRKAINSGDIETATKLLYDLKSRGKISTEAYDRYVDSIRTTALETKRLKQQKQNLNKYISGDGTLDNEGIIDDLNNMGIRVNNKKDLKKLLKNLKGENKYRKNYKGDPTTKAMRENLSDDGSAITGWLEKIYNYISGVKESANKNGIGGLTQDQVAEIKADSADSKNIMKDRIQSRDNKLESKKATLRTFGVVAVDKDVVNAISNDTIYSIVLGAAKMGVKLDKDHILNLTKCNNKTLKYLKDNPTLASMDPKSINRYLGKGIFSRSFNKKSNRNSLTSAISEGLDMSSIDNVKDFMGNKKKDRNKRLEYYKKFKTAGLLDKYDQKYIMSANYRDLDMILRNSKANIEDNPDAAESQASEDGSLGSKVKSGLAKVKTIFTSRGILNYIRDNRGNYSLAKNKQTNETIARQKSDLAVTSSIGDKLGSIKDSLFGFFKHQRDKEENDKKKEPWYKKLFNFDLSTITGKLKFGASVLGLFTGIGAITNLVRKINTATNTDGKGGIVDKIGVVIKDKLSGPLTTVKEWITNTGKYETKGGLQGFLSDHVFPNMFTGMNVIFKYVIPAMIKAFIVNIPTLIKAGISGIGTLLGIGKNKHKNDNKFSKASISAGADVGSGNTSLPSGSGWKMDTSYFKTTQSQAKEIATATLTTASNAASGNDSSFDVDDINVSDTTVTTEGDTSTSTGKSGKEKVVKDNRQAMISNGNTKVPMYKKNKKGKLVPMTMTDINKGNVTEYYNQKGVKFTYDEDTGNFVGENDSPENTDNVVKRAGKAAAKSALTGKPMGILRIISKIAEKAGNRTAGKLVNKALDLTWAGKTIKFAGKSTAAVNRAAANTGGLIKGAASKISGRIAQHNIDKAGKIVQNGITKGMKAGDAAKLVDGKLEKIAVFIKTGLQNLFNNSLVFNRVKEALKSTGAKATNSAVGQKISKMISGIVERFNNSAIKRLGPKGVGELAAKVASKVAIIAKVGFIIKDFIWGWNQAESILGIQEVTVVQKLIAAVANFITNYLFNGFIDTSTIVGWCIDTVFPMFGIDTQELQKEREEADKAVEQYNIENGTNLSKEEYLKKDKFTYKIEKAVGNVKENVGKAWSFVKKGAGNAWNSAKKGTSDVINEVKTGAAKSWKSFKDSAAMGWDNIQKKAIAKGDEIAKKTADSINATSENIGNAWNSAKKGTSDVINEVKTNASKSWKSFKDSAASGWDSIQTKTITKANELAKKTADSINAASAVMESTVETAVTKVQEIYKGIKKVRRSIRKSTNEMLINAWNGDIGKVFTEVKDPKLKNQFLNKTVKLIEYVNKLPMAIPTVVSASVGFVVRHFKEIVSGIKGIGRGLVGTVKTMAASASKGDLNGVITANDNTNTGNGFVDGVSNLANNAIKMALFPQALLGTAVGKAVSTVKSAFNTIKKCGTLSKKDKNIIEKANNAKISPFSSKYWKVNNNKDGIAGGLYTFNSLMRKVLNLPSAMLAMVNPKNWLKKVKNAIKSKIDDITGSDDDKPKKKDGDGKGSGKTKGFVSQLDPQYRNIRFNRSGDTQTQTLGDSGCGPATAANVINILSGKGSEMADASKAALQYKDKNGGVRPEYFENYLGKKGFSTKSTMNKKEMVSNIANGKPTILLGADPSNKANTPYGSASSHYVLATGMDGRGNVIVQDPESRRPNSLYPLKDLMSQTQFGMGVNRRQGLGSGKISEFKSSLRAKFSKLGFGRGNTANRDLATWTPITADELQSFMNSYAGGGKNFQGKAQVFIDAGKASGLDPRYLMAHAAVETGWGTSDICTAYNNFYGIGAFDTNPEYSSNYANGSFASGVIDGAKWIRKNYYDAGQKTLHQMRYNGGQHEYCTSTTWVQTIASIMDAMPENGKAKYHDAGDLDGSYSSDGDNSDSSSKSGGILDKLSNLPRAYFGKLYDLFYGADSSNDDGNSDSDTTSVGSNLGSGIAKEFHDKYLGKRVDVDGLYGAQCFDLFNRFKIDHVDGKAASGYNYAKELYPEVGGNPSKFTQLPLSKAEYGDWVIWGPGSETGYAGHVGMFMEQQGNRILTFGQNQGEGANLTTGKAASEDTITTNGVLGVLRPKLSGSGSGKEKIGNYLKEISSGNYGKKMIKMPGKNVKTPYVNINAPETYSTLDDPKFRKSSLFGGSSTGLGLSGKGTLPSLKPISGLGEAGVNNSSLLSSSTQASNNKLINTIIDILTIIADNTSKLSDVVALLSKALDLNLTTDEISSLSSNNSQIKNKIANALKSQGSANGLGSSVMTSSTESLANALYSIARA